MKIILYRENPQAEWKPYTEIISTDADAKKFVEFLKSLGTGYEFKLEEEK